MLDQLTWLKEDRIMAKATAKRSAKSISLAPRKKKTRGVKTMDGKFFGDEPTWEATATMSEEDFNVFKMKAYTWYGYFHKGVDLKKNLYIWMKENDYLAAEIKAARAFPDSNLLPSVGYNATMLLRGMPADDTAWLRGKVAEMIEFGTAKLAGDKKNDKASSKIHKPTIQDRMRDQLSEFIGEMDEWEDKIFSDKKFVAPKAFDWLKLNNVAQSHINKIKDYYAPKIAELDELSAKEPDPDLKGAYSYLSKPDLKRVREFYTNLIHDLESYQTVKKVARKTRAKKAPSKDKLVQKMKFKAEDNDLKMVSISPVQIVGAETVWVYNTKTRKLGVYKADPLAGQLSVKGSTIIGFDEKLSIAKTIRKPAIQLKDFSKAGKVKLRSFLEDITAVSIKLTGRINKDTMILRAD